MKFRYLALLLAILLAASVVGFRGYQLKVEVIEPLGLEEYLEKSIFELPFLAKTDDILLFYIEYADELLADLTEPTEPEIPTDPTEDNTQPTEQPTVPVTKPTDPGTDPNAPTVHNPTQIPTEPNTKPTEPATKPTEKPTEPKPSAVPTFDFPADRVPDSWYENTLFIGNSQMNGLAHYARVPNAHYYAKDAMTFVNVFKKELSDKDNFQNMTLEKLLTTRQYDKIVLNFGFNEAGAGGFKWFSTRFDQFMEKIRTWQPNAKIIINAIMPVSRGLLAERGEAGNCWKPENLKKLNDFFKSYANGVDVFYIDCTPYFGDQDGYMFDSITNDGIHVKVKYYKVWRDWMSYASSTLGI
jgi:hypothetical protein